MSTSKSTKPGQNSQLNAVALEGTNVQKPGLDLLANANMTVTNDLKQPTVVTTTDSQHMADIFDNQTLGGWQRSKSSHVSASMSLGQSSFTISCTNYENQSDSFKVNIGEAEHVTNVTFPGTGRVGGLLAPTVPFSTNPNFNFYFFVGPGLLQAQANSAIQANLPAILSWLKANPIKFDLPAGLTFLLNNIQLNSTDVTCSYAAITPAAGDNGFRRVNINAVLNIARGRVEGSLGLSKGEVNVPVAGVTIGGLSVLIQATADLSDLSKSSILLTRLQCSLNEIEVDSIIITILQEIEDFWVFALLLKIIASPYRIAGAINSNKVGMTTTNWNEDILKKMNDIISNILTPKKPLTNLLSVANRVTLVQQTVSLVGQSPLRIKSNWKSTVRETLKRVISKTRRSKEPSKSQLLSTPPATSTDYSTWMSTPAIQSKLLSQLKMPGTHDSATYGLTNTLSDISYSDTAFLWKLSPESAPLNEKLPFGGTYYLGTTLYQFVMQNIMNVSVAQDLSLYRQLKEGIRYFDLRIYYSKSDGHFYAQHGLRGPLLADILNDVAQYLSEYPSSKELIWLLISHTNFGDFPGDIPSKAAAMIKRKLGQHIYLPPGAAGVPNYDIQTNLGSKRVSEIVGNSAKVIVLNTDTGNPNAPYLYQDTVINTAGFATSGRSPGGTDNVEDLISLEGNVLGTQSKAPLPLYEISWTLTGQTSDVVRSILYFCSGAYIFDDQLPYPYLLRDMAITANTQLHQFLQSKPTAWNVVTMDWVEFPTTATSPAGIVIGMN